MSKESYLEFVKKSESLVKPEDSTAISFLGNFNKYLPKDIQRKIMENGSRKTPYMGFIVDPYCFFLSFPIKDERAAEDMLPDGYELADVSLLHGQTKGPLVIISTFSLRTSVFTGMRVECYIIARNRASGNISWIITDYETNTTSHDPKNGFCGYTCDPAVFTTTPFGELVVEAHNKKNGNHLSMQVDIASGTIKKLDKDLWVEGNLDVNYGGRLKSPQSPSFSLIFDPVLMNEAVQIKLDKVVIGSNTLMNSVIDGAHPSCAAIFPYTQHFIIRQDLHGKPIANSTDLMSEVDYFLERQDFKTMKGDDIKRPLFRSMMISLIVNIVIIVILLVLHFLR